MGRFHTRDDVQATLEANALGAEVSYLDREGTGSPDNWIVYSRDAAESIYADDVIHIRIATLSVVHYHKKKMDSIEPLMREAFQVEPSAYSVKQPETDYFATYYTVGILTSGEW
jgi:hypothetical protein